MRNDDKIKYWFTTEKGVHVPVKEGQSKEEALKERFSEPKFEKVGLLDGMGEHDELPEERGRSRKGKEERDEENKTNYSESGKRFLKLLRDNVDFLEVKNLPKPLSEPEIISKTSGADFTEGGSCVSVALCYIGNLFGFDVKDFRGGNSRTIFADSSYSDDFWDIPSLKVDRQYDRDGYKIFDKLSQKFEPGNMYIVGIGSHCAIVKKGLYDLKYLELQSGTSRAFGAVDTEKLNGWHMLGRRALEKRFGVKEREYLQGANIVIQTGLACNVQNFKNCTEFKEILGYINTQHTE